jgi:hypothetical protein
MIQLLNLDAGHKQVVALEQLSQARARISCKQSGDHPIFAGDSLPVPQSWERATDGVDAHTAASQQTARPLTARRLCRLCLAFPAMVERQSKAQVRLVLVLVSTSERIS